MDVRSPLFQNIACILMGVLFLNPIVSTAAELSVDAAAGGNTQLGSAQNGVPVVNIATPNGNGLSHNKFTDYNVGQQGLILNNGTAKFNETQLGGVILGNSNLNGRAANLILNEVTGGNQSQLKGYTEVAGQGAHVVVANPHGITCDGCGFINTPQATLTTGTPVIDNGRLDHYDVNGGEIAIEGAGINAANISQFDLITRSAKLNAQLQAQRLNIIAGRNEVDATTLAATAKADDGSDKPLLAIDSSALGGMYAGAIRLVGTEAGVGVKLSGDMAASADDIEIDANGKLTVARAASGANLRASATQIELTDRVYAGKNASLTADRIDIASSLASGNDLRLNSAQINNQGRLEAGVNADGSGNSAALLDVQGGTLNNHGSVTSQGRLNTDLQQLNNQGQKVLAVGDATVKATNLNNAGGQLVAQKTLRVTATDVDNSAGTLASNKALSLTLAGTLDNRADGLLLSKADGLTLNLDSLLNQSGTVQAEGGALTVVSRDTDNSAGTLQGDSLDLTARRTLTNDNGRIAATQGQHTLTAGAVSNQGGSLLAATTLKATAASLNNQGGRVGAQHIDLDLSGDLNNASGLVEASTTLLLKADGLSNNAGKLRALGSSGASRFVLGGLFNNDGGLVEIGNSQLTLTSAALSNQNGNVRHLGSQGFALSLADAGQAGGRFVTNGELNLDVADWSNSSLLQAQKISLKVGTFTQSATGQLLSVESINASGDTWHNDGRIETDGDLSLTLTGDYTGNGALQSAGNLKVSAANASTGSGALWKAGGTADFSIGGNLVNQGQLTAAQSLIARANSLSNYGTLGAATTLRIEADNLLNDSGLLFSGSDMALRTTRFTNRLATVYSLAGLSIAANDQGDAATLVENRSGTLESSGDMSIHATTLNNVRDVLTPIQSKYSARIAELPCSGYYGAGDCSGKRNGVWEIEEFDRLAVSPDSTAASFLTAGGKLNLRGNALSNQSSSISAGSDLTVQVNDLQNTGIETGEVRTYRVFRSERTNSIDSWQNEASQFTAAYWNKPSVDSNSLIAALNHFIGRTEAENTAFRVITPIPSGDLSYAGILQAGGNVSISAQAGFDSSVVRPTFAYVAGGYLADTNAAGSTLATAVSLNPQLPPDTTQQPVTLPTFSLPQGQNGLFHVNTDSSHPYLVETNPAFATLRGFLSSDYLLGIIGYNQDLTQRRLGDGLYEQRLVQQAIVARTGKRFLDGLSSDEAQFKYLMDNAIASKQALNLVPGIALSAEQVAALTHDIVWMQEQEVDGQKVLVPVLYLAQASDRLSPTGALIQGKDLTLISGSELKNSGTLRASNNLNLSANRISNSGLLQSNERLSLLATDSIRNTQGGIIAGKNVSAIALSGDIVNERSVTTHQSAKTGFERREDFVDNAAGIEASNTLTLSAGRDLNNQGGTLKAGGNADLSAGRDLLITSQSETDVANNRDSKGYSNRSQTSQYGSNVQVGGDLTAEAGRDLSVVASNVKAAGDIDLQANGVLTLGAAAKESHYDGKHKGGSRSTARTEDHVNQVGSVINAGGNFTSSSGADTTLIASQVNAGKEAYLYAKGDLKLETAQNEDYSYAYEKKKSSGFLSSSKKSTLDEHTQVTNVGSAVTSKGDALLVAKNDIRVMGSTVESASADVSLIAGNDVQIGSVSDLTQSRQDRKTDQTSWGGYKAGKASNNLSETSTQSVGSLISGDNVSIQAGRDAQVTGSGVVGTHDVELIAERDLKIDAATNTFSREESYKVKSRDLTGLVTGNNLGLDDLTGKQHLSISSGKGNSEAQETTLSGSTIGSSEGNVTLTAGRKLEVVASDLVSTKDLTLTGSDVTIAAGLETAKQSSEDTSHSLAVGRVVGGLVVDAGKSIYYNVKAANNTDDDRLKAVKTAQAVMSAYSLTQQGSTASANIAEGKPANSSGSLIKIGTELALTNKKSTSEYTSEQAKQSNLTAGGTLSIVANGADAASQGDIHVIGSNLKATDTELLAKRNITLESAQNRSEWENQSTTNRTAVGASFNIGEQNGFTLDLGASIGKGEGKGREVTQVNSQLETGSLLLVSGKDTTLAGAQVHADKVQAAIGGDLNIASRQDEAKSKQSQKDGGFGASICVPPFCYGATVSASASIGGSQSDMSYRAVTDQTGIYAGTGGYNIDVDGTTRLQGAVIASDAAAEKNRLSTNRLEFSDLTNKSEINTQAASLSVSYSSSGQTKGGDEIKATSGLGGGLPLSLTESDKSTTRSAISQGTIEVRDSAGMFDLVGLSRDTANANQGLERPDEKELQTRLELVQSTAALGQSVVNAIAQAKQKEADEKIAKAQQTKDPKDSIAAQLAMYEAAKWNVGGDSRLIADIAAGLLAAGLGGTGTSTTIGIVANTTAADTYKRIGDYAEEKAQTATDPATKALWEEGGAARVALHAAAGALQGLAGGTVQSGAIGAGASAALMPAINKALESSGAFTTKESREAVSTLLAASLGIATAHDTAGQVAGGNAAAGVELYNRQLHAEEKKTLALEAKRLADETGKTVVAPGMSWEDLLLFVSGATVDATEQARLIAALNSFSENNGAEVDKFARDLAVAQEVVKRLADKNTPLTWSDGTQIVANGAPVFAFQSTNEQFRDALLFNSAVKDVTLDLGDGVVIGNDPVPPLWKSQFGEAAASKYFYEIMAASTSQSDFDEAFERLSTVASGGIKDVHWDVDLILATVGPGGVGQLVKNFLMSRAASAAGKAGAEQLTKEELVNFLAIDSAKYVTSKVVQKDTTVVLTEDVLLANGTTVPKGSLVLVNGDAMKIVSPDGRIIRESYSTYVNMPEYPATSMIAKEGLYNDLLAAQARDALIGTTLPGAKAPVTVTAEGSVGGQILVDTNQTARPAIVADANKPTIIADLIPPGKPNSTMANAHAEIAVIQRAYDSGITNGQSMSIVVRGEEVCAFCQSSTNIIAAAERSGLNSLKLVEAKTGKTFTWIRGVNGWQ